MRVFVKESARNREERLRGGEGIDEQLDDQGRYPSLERPSPTFRGRRGSANKRQGKSGDPIREKVQESR